MRENLGSFEVYIRVVKLAIFFFILYAAIYLATKEYYLAIFCIICVLANIGMLFIKSDLFSYFIVVEHVLVTCLACLGVARMGWDCGIQYLFPMAIALGFFAPFKNNNTMTIINIIETILFISLYVVFHDKTIVAVPLLQPFVPMINLLSATTCSICILVATRMRDVSNAFKNLKMRNINAELATLADQDGLTKLYNRRSMENILSSIWQKSKDADSHFWVIMCDIDRFKEINDTAGHDAGDNALIAVAKALQSAFRSSDYISRWGGDEFLVAIKDPMDSDTALRSIKKAQSKIREINFRGLGLNAPISATMGASSSKGKESLAHLLRSADEGLYKGKSQGRNAAIVN